MSVIQIIAGPPGIGKSTVGPDYVDPDLDILNEDDMRMRYKDKGYADYNEYSLYRVRDIIKQKLIKNKDFALELNLGFQHQYDYVISAKRFNEENRLEVILFYSDSLMLCLDRARERHESGLHLVLPEIVTEMYHNTITLLKNNFGKIDLATFIDADKDNNFVLIASYDGDAKALKMHDDKVNNWFQNDVRLFIEEQLSM